MDESFDEIDDAVRHDAARRLVREKFEDARIEYAERIPISNPEARLVREVLARHQRELTELAMEIAQDRGIDTTRYTLQSRPTGIAWELNPPPAHVIDLDAMAKSRDENGA